jgi:hypothetical protein
MPRAGPRAAALGALAVALYLAAPALAQDPPPSFRAERAQGPVEIDGRLDEPTWQAADTLTRLLQREPIEGAPATERTVFRILYDDDNLYIGVAALDTDPDAVVARLLERDALARFGLFGNLLESPDDMIAIVLDTFHDRRNAFLFATNALGNQSDALIENEGQDVNDDWDGIWEVAGRRDAGGWTAELAIPFRTLRFPAHSPQTWGFNAARVIKRKNEEVLWSSWGRDNGGLFKIARAGDLTGLAGLRQGANLQIEPYVLGRVRGAANVDPEEFDDDEEISAGGDAKWGITPNQTLDLTVHTDFAQVEADVAQINLTRFSLFFPEKREFFLENAGIFEFGIEGFGPPPLLLFFSRRIGIAGGREVPLLGGARLTGRAGPWSIGALDVVTADEGDEPRTNWSVARVRRNLLARGQVGGIVTHVEPADSEGSTAFGADFSFQPTNEILLTGMAAANLAPDDPSEPYAGSFVFDHTGDFWGSRASWDVIGEGMRPAAGFVQRSGIHRGFGTLRQRPRPGGIVRLVTIRQTVEIILDTDGTVEDRSFGLSFEPQLETGDELRLEFQRRSERLEEPFELRPDLVIPADEYWNTSWIVGFETARRRPLWVEATYSEPGFFDGDRRVTSGEVGWTPSPHVGLSLAWERNEIETPHGDLETDLGILRLGLAASTRLRWDALVQYNSESDELSGNLRLHWIWAPGSDLYLVADLRRDELREEEGASTRAVVLKVTRLVWF